MSETKVTSIRLPADLLEKARNLGLNISKVCENCLRAAVRRLEGYTVQTQFNGGFPVTPVLQKAQNPRNPTGERQINIEPNINSQLRWPSWLGHRLGKAEVAGSNPARGFYMLKRHAVGRRYTLRQS